MGFDLNRHWLEPSPWAHPTLYATKNLMMEMDANDVRGTPMCCDCRYPTLMALMLCKYFVLHCGKYFMEM